MSVADELVHLSPRVSYIPASYGPLSADVTLIRGDKYLWIYDVGARPEVAEYLNALPGPKKVILSHFHIDHSKNLPLVHCEELYLGDYAAKRFGTGTAVTEELRIPDGVELRILPVPNCHAKGSLAVEADGEILLLGDAAYSHIDLKAKEYCFNVQLLNEELRFLEQTSALKICRSHCRGYVKSREEVIGLLREYYGRRTPDSPYIFLPWDE